MRAPLTSSSQRTRGAHIPFSQIFMLAEADKQKPWLPPVSPPKAQLETEKKRDREWQAQQRKV